MVIEKMKVYARVKNGVVMELLATGGDITAMFHPDIKWVQASDVAGIACGWRYDDDRLQPPAQVAALTPATDVSQP